MTKALRPSDSARTVRRVFLSALLVLFIPARLLALAHGADIARFLGAAGSTLVVGWLLYRVCMRATRKAWFTALSIPALYIAVFGAPIYAWGVLLILVIARLIVDRYLPEPTRVDATAGTSTDDSLDLGQEPGPTTRTATPIQVVNLDRLCTQYRRVLFTLRTIRAATAALAGTALLATPAMLFFGAYDFGAPGFGLVTGLALTIFLCGMCALSLWWQWALWRGAVTAGRIGVVVTGLFAAAVTVTALMTIEREWLFTGDIWFHLVAYALQLALIIALGAGSAIVMRRQDDEALMSILRYNARHTWRDALLQLAGIVPSRGTPMRALTHRSVVLSALALCIEGFAFYVYFKAAGNFIEASKLLVWPFPGQPSALEQHYFSLVTIGALMLPVLYVSTQLALSLAERMRSAARRAVVLSAEDVRADDARAPVLFLRDFTDDQVSLHRAALPGWVRVLDPGVEQENLEDVMQSYASVGPVVAIGRPKDVVPPVGAARHYVRDGGWKSVVLALMDAASVVVVGVSESSGLTWEIDQLRDHGHVRKTIFILPPTRGNNHRLLRHLVLRLPATSDTSASDAAAAALMLAIGSQLATGLALRGTGIVAFATRRRPSQVEFDVTLRLALPTNLPKADRLIPQPPFC